MKGRRRQAPDRAGGEPSSRQRGQSPRGESNRGGGGDRVGGRPFLGRVSPPRSHFPPSIGSPHTSATRVPRGPRWLSKRVRPWRPSGDPECVCGRWREVPGTSGLRHTLSCFCVV